MRVFALVGTRLEPFDRFVRMVDDAIERSGLDITGRMQSGTCTVLPERLESSDWMPRRQFDEELDRADAVITHGGVGSIHSAIRLGHRPIMVPRLLCHHEHVTDDTPVTSAISRLGLAMEARDAESMAEALRRIASGEMARLPEGERRRDLTSLSPIQQALAPRPARPLSALRRGLLTVVARFGPRLDTLRKLD